MPKRTDIKKIMLIGSGPIVIGQACEFDYSGVQACKALREEGYEVVLVNSNPATIMTDPEFADRTYIEPLTAEIVTEIIRRERPDALLPTLGGQTGLNLAIQVHDQGVLAQDDRSSGIAEYGTCHGTISAPGVWYSGNWGEAIAGAAVQTYQVQYFEEHPLCSWFQLLQTRLQHLSLTVLPTSTAHP